MSRKVNPTWEGVNADIMEVEDEVYNKKENKRMHIEQIQHGLEETGKLCLQLAKEIMHGGRPLTEKEKSIVKMIQYGYLKSRLDEAAMFYFMNNKADFQDSLEQVLQVFVDDSVI